MFMKIEYMKYICYLPASFYHSCGREDVLVKQHAMRMPQIFICGLSDSSIFFHIITKIDLKIIIIIIIIIINFTVSCGRHVNFLGDVTFRFSNTVWSLEVCLLFVQYKESQ